MVCVSNGLPVRFTTYDSWLGREVWGGVVPLDPVGGVVSRGHAWEVWDNLGCGGAWVVSLEGGP